MKGKQKPSDDSFTLFVIDQLGGLGAVEARSLFGGKGLYWKDLIFGLIDEGRLYFRVSEETVRRYQAEGSKAFEPWPGHVMNGYYELPGRVLEDVEQAAQWAREAWSLPRRKERKGDGRKKGRGTPRARRKSRPS